MIAMRRFYTVFLFLFTCLCVVQARAQSGMTFDELRERLNPYFADELITDVKSQLPQGSPYRIWGWDVGDYSGDGYPDIALALRSSAERKKIMDVYLFVDIDGYLTNVGKFDYPFVELPLEVGVVIKENACLVMQKQELYHWSVTGYRFDNGSLIVLDTFKTEQIKGLTHESYRNFQTLYGYEKYKNIQSGELELSSEFLSIPSYARGQYVYKGFAVDAESNSIRFVPKGAYYWQGEEDASFKVRSAYDEQFLYLLIRVTDDKVVTTEKEDGVSDKVEIWFDVSNQPNRFLKHRSKKMEFRTVADSGIYSFTILPGNFTDKKASVHVSATDEMTDLQRQAVSQISVAAFPWDKGYIVKVRIPFQLLGFDGAPMEQDKITELGCTVAVDDVDNAFRPEEETVIATSHLETLNPSSYGTLLLLPGNLNYGESTNIYIDPVAEHLKDLGF